MKRLILAESLKQTLFRLQDVKTIRLKDYH